MKKNKILLSVLPVLVLLFALSLTSFAADSYSVEENTVHVSTYAELKAELEDLNATADSNKLVVLKNNISVTNQDNDYNISISYPGKLFLDLNGYKLNNTTDIWDYPTAADNNWSLLSVKGGKLTIKGNGTFTAKENDCYAVDVQDGGHVIIEDGEYVGNIHAVYVEEGTAEIRGGKYSVQQKFSDPTKADEFVLNCYDANRANGTAKIIVTGGEFVSFNPADCAAEGAHTNFLAAGYKSTQIGDSYFVTKAGVTPVANDAGLRDALNSSEGTVATINLVSGEFNWPDNKSDSGQKWPKTINVVGTNPEVCSVKLNAGSYPEDCDVLFENITIDNAVGCKYEEAALAQMVRVKNVTVKNCVIKNQFRILAKDVVNISDCKFVNRNASGFDGYCLNYYGYSGSRVNVENCVFDATQKAIVMYAESPAEYNLNVENCKFSASDRTTDKAAIQMHTEHGISGTVTIKDCVVEGFKANALSPEGLWWEGNNVGSKPATKKFNITVNGVNVQTAE